MFSGQLKKSAATNARCLATTDYEPLTTDNVN